MLDKGFLDRIHSPEGLSVMVERGCIDDAIKDGYAELAKSYKPSRIGKVLYAAREGDCTWEVVFEYSRPRWHHTQGDFGHDPMPNGQRAGEYVCFCGQIIDVNP